MLFYKLKTMLQYSFAGSFAGGRGGGRAGRSVQGRRVAVKTVGTEATTRRTDGSDGRTWRDEGRRADDVRTTFSQPGADV